MHLVGRLEGRDEQARVWSRARHVLVLGTYSVASLQKKTTQKVLRQIKREKLSSEKRTARDLDLRAVVSHLAGGSTQPHLCLLALCAPEDFGRDEAALTVLPEAEAGVSTASVDLLQHAARILLCMLSEEIFRADAR